MFLVILHPSSTRSWLAGLSKEWSVQMLVGCCKWEPESYFRTERIWRRVPFWKSPQSLGLMNKWKQVQGLWLLFSCWVLSSPLWSRGLQHASFPILQYDLEFAQTHVHWWYQRCHPAISSSCHPLLLLPSVVPSIRVFSNESALCIRWPKHWSVSISPSNEYSGLISFRIDWFDLPAVQGTLTVVEPRLEIWQLH